MTWLAWRQFRTQALVGAGLLAALTALLLSTGLSVRELYSSLGGAHCGALEDCSALSTHDRALERMLMDLLGPALIAVPALIGMFWGAPLVAREIEGGTFKLAWTQSITRRRWLTSRIAIVGLAALCLAGLASLLVSWWFAPFDAVSMDRFDPSVFDVRGIVAIGYAGFAFALGVAAGAAIRRTLPAMVTTLLGFAAARIAFTLWVRPHLLTATHRVFPLTLGGAAGFLGPKGIAPSAGPFGITIFAGPPSIPNAWSISASIVDRAHRALGAAKLHEAVLRYCPRLASALAHGPGASVRKGPGGMLGGVFTPCLNSLSHHLQLLVAYQPPGHWWPLQWLETGIFLAAALTLIGLTVWRIGPRRARTSAAGASRGPTPAGPAVRKSAPPANLIPVD